MFIFSLLIGTKKKSKAEIEFFKVRNLNAANFKEQ